MAYYKIKSLTTKLPKRHKMKDSSLNIEYRQKFNTTKHFLPAGGTVYISAPSLPINLHQLRMKKMVSIVEIGKNTFMKLTDPTNIKKVKTEVEEVVEEPKKEVKQKVEVEETEEENEDEDKPKRRTYKKKTQKEDSEES
jgi:hypothetical protein